MAVHYFSFGKYEGKGVSQTSLAVGNVTGKGGWGYPYVHWAAHNLTRLEQGLKDDLKRHIHVLNHFTSALPCQHCKNSDVKYFSVYRNSKGNHITGAYVFCSKECSQTTGASDYLLEPLGFDVLLKIDVFNKIDQKNAHETMRRVIGWPESKKVTDDAAADFIDALEKRLR